MFEEFVTLINIMSYFARMSAVRLSKPGIWGKCITYNYKELIYPYTIYNTNIFLEDIQPLTNLSKLPLLV